MIASFKDKETEWLWRGLRCKLPPPIQLRALRLLRLLDENADWHELGKLPSADLHPLHGDRAGQYAVRVNMQWRVVFTPGDGAVHDVEVTDYH